MLQFSLSRTSVECEITENSLNYTTFKTYVCERTANQNNWDGINIFPQNCPENMMDHKPNENIWEELTFFYLNLKLTQHNWLKSHVSFTLAYYCWLALLLRNNGSRIVL